MDRPIVDTWQRADDYAAVRLVVVVFRGECVLVCWLEIYSNPSIGIYVPRLGASSHRCCSLLRLLMLLRMISNLADVSLALSLTDTLMAACLF